jgi:hypothetical protein
MNWIISDFNNILVILCGVFYSILCIFSIVTGIIYASGKRELNPIELSNKTVKKLDTKEKLNKFAIKMGYVTFIVGIVQGITAFALFKGYSMILYIIAFGFTIFSILSVSFKLKGKLNSFSLIKFVFYVLILIILLLKSTRILFF